LYKKDYTKYCRINKKKYTTDNFHPTLRVLLYGKNTTIFEPVYGFKPYKYTNIYASCTSFFFVYC